MNAVDDAAPGLEIQRYVTMQFILFTRHRLAALALTLVPSAVLGCDMEPDHEVELRAGYLTPNEPIPGGGVCHGCISDWDISLPEGEEAHRLLRICIDTGVRYTGASVRKVDDLNLHDILTTVGPQWRILGDRNDQSSDLCVDGCVGVRATDDPASTRTIVHVKLDSTDERSPQILRFYAVGGSSLKLGDDLPSLTFPPASGNFSCLSAGDMNAQPLASPDAPPALDVVKPAMAHITHPSPSGGVRSCSGFLVGPMHVLTAEHCFDDLTDLTAINVRIGESSEPSSVAMIHLYDPNQDGLADLDLAMLELHDPVVTKPLKVVDPASKPDGMNTLYGYGYGVLDPKTLLDANTNDWGQLKRVSLKQTTKLLLTKQIEAIASHPIKPIYLVNGETDSIGLCRGDSGGPIIRSDSRVVAVSFGRILGGVPMQNNQDLPLPLFESMMRAFAFSRGNLCGGTPLQAYVATAITAAVYQWIGTIASELPSGPLPPPGFEHVDLPLPPPPETM